DAFGDDARIYLAKYDGKTIAGALDVLCGDKVWYVYGASSNEYRNVMPPLKQKPSRLPRAKKTIRTKTLYGLAK
ncbi:MAG: hypothetical protein IJC20_00545, partial [Clostridia bacterium]|nr:hypothetical protein [Clostridia bacterium]